MTNEELSREIQNFADNYDATEYPTEDNSNLVERLLAHPGGSRLQVNLSLALLIELIEEAYDQGYQTASRW